MNMSLYLYYFRFSLFKIQETGGKCVPQYPDPYRLFTDFKFYIHINIVNIPTYRPEAYRADRFGILPNYST